MAKAYEGNEPYIFISYSHKDTAVVMPVIEALEERGFLVWFDGGIEAGSEWPEYIASHIDNCGCMLNFVSKAYEDSFHCRSEMVYALDRKKPFLSVYLLDDDKVLSSGLRMQLGLNQAMWKKNFARDEDFYDAVCNARALLSCKKGTAQNQTQQTPPQNQTQQTPLKNQAPQMGQNANANFRQQPMGNMQNQRPNAFISGNGFVTGNGMGANYNGTYGNTAYANRPAGTGYQNPQPQQQNNYGGYQGGGQQNNVQRPMNGQGMGTTVSKLDAPVKTDGVYDTKKKGKGCLVTFIILLLLAAAVAALLYFKPFGLDGLFEELGFGERVEDVEDDNGDLYDDEEPEDPREGLERHETGELVFYLPKELEEAYYEDDYASFESEEVYISVLMDYFSEDVYDENTTLKEFALDVCELFSVYGAGPIVYDEDLAYFVYDDGEFTYFTALYKSSSAFWIVQSICYSDDYDAYEEDFIKWAKLVEVN